MSLTVLPAGIEPATRRFRIVCSAIELWKHLLSLLQQQDKYYHTLLNHVKYREYQSAVFTCNHLPDNENMDSLLWPFIGILFAIGIYHDLDRIEKRAIRKNDLLKYGTKFDGYIIGVAIRKKVIDAEELDDTSFLGSKKENITGWYNRGKYPVPVEEAGASRVKISFLHPETGLHTVIRTILEKQNCRNSRIYRISQPNLMRFNNVGFIIWNHDRRVFSAYKEEVNSRNISDEDKKTLLREARQAKKAHYDKYYALLPKDGEGYNYIIPSVKVQGYYLDSDFLFIQRTNDLLLEDWTKDLE